MRARTRAVSFAAEPSHYGRRWMPNWVIDYKAVPRHLRDGLLRYINDGIRPGGFLCAVLENDLTEALARADPESLEALPHLSAWLYNMAPSRCYGSPQRMAAWLKAPPWRTTYPHHPIMWDQGV